MYLVSRANLNPWSFITKDDKLLFKESSCYGPVPEDHLVFRSIKLPKVHSLAGKTLFLSCRSNYWHMLADELCDLSLLMESGINLNEFEKTKINKSKINMFRSLGDIRKEEEKKKGDKKTTAYTGGEKSGMEVENPDDIEGVIEQAKKNSEKRKDLSSEELSQKPDTEIRITLYSNGFTVEGGEFRDYNTEENKAFMKELNEGYVPKELRA